MNDPRMMKLMQQMMAKRQSPEGQVIPETDMGEGMKVESPDQGYETSPEIQALVDQLSQNPASPSEAEVAPESIDMKKAAIEKIKQKYLGR
jgi:hypothetical protein